MILRCGDSHSQCLYCRQTLGWPHQFLEHKTAVKAKSQHYCLLHLLNSPFFALGTHCPHRLGGFTCKVLLVPLGWGSHTPHHVCSLYRFSSPYWSKLQKHYTPSAQHPWLLAATEDHYCRKHVHFLYSVASPENLGWHCWFWCSMREKLLLGELHWITAMTFRWLSGFCLSNTRYNLHGCSSKIVSQLLIFGGRKEGKWQAQHFLGVCPSPKQIRHQ